MLALQPLRHTLRYRASGLRGVLLIPAALLLVALAPEIGVGGVVQGDGVAGAAGVMQAQMGDLLSQSQTASREP